MTHLCTYTVRLYGFRQNGDHQLRHERAAEAGSIDDALQCTAPCRFADPALWHATKHLDGRPYCWQTDVDKNGEFCTCVIS